MSILGFKLPDGFDQGYLTAELAGEFLFEIEKPSVKRFAIYDTFDWRLYNKAWVLFRLEDVLMLRRLSDGATIKRVVNPLESTFTWELPDGQLKEQLTPVLDVRALLKLAEGHVRSVSLRILNQEEKTVARIINEELRLSYDGSEPPLVSYLWVMPIRGYPRYYRELVDSLKRAKFPILDYEGIYLNILDAMGEEPGGYSSKLDLQLEPGNRADEAMKVILYFLFQVIRRNEAGIKDDIDTEFLHDFRVAVRRTRSALTQIKGVFLKETTDRFKGDFATLGDLTNQLRDLDVYLLKENTYKARLSPALREDLNPLFDYLRDKRTAALSDVIDGLNSEVYMHTLDDWGAFLRSPSQESPTSPNAGRPIIDLAKERIYKRYRSIVKTGNLILNNGDEEMLHALRIECKKLRYLIEFFSSLFPRKKTSALITHLKNLQDNLGDFNDLCVQEAYLLNIAEELPVTDERHKKTLVAIGSLVETLASEKRRVVDAFAEVFFDFISSNNRELFRELFRQKDKKAVS